MPLTRKKICFIAASPLSINEFLVNHINSLSFYFDIHIVTNMNTPFNLELSSSVKTFNLSIERKPSLLKDLGCISPLVSYLSSHQFDAVHTIDPKAGFIGMICAFIARVPIRVHIFTGQAWYTKKGIVKNLLQYADKLIVKIATNILLDGKSQKEFLVKNRIVSETNAIVLGEGSISGVDKAKFTSDGQIRAGLRRKYNILENSIVYVFLGRLNKDKGVLDLAESFYTLNQSFNNCKLFFIGADEEDIELIVKTRFNCDNIIFTGYTNEPFKLLQIADVFCFPSYREGFGTSVIEASMLKIPVICSDTYGLRDTMIDGVTGLRHQVGNIDDLRTKMQLLYQDSTLRNSLGINGFNYVSQKFDAEDVTSLWVDFYKKTLKVD